MILQRHIAESDFETVNSNYKQPLQNKKEKIARSQQGKLIADLYRVDLQINSIWDLVNSGKDYQIALPILVEHLAGDYHPDILEGIILALSIPAARGVASAAILNLFKATTNKNIKSATAYALSLIATRLEYEELRKLVLLPENDSVVRNLVIAINRIDGTMVSDNN